VPHKLHRYLLKTKEAHDRQLALIGEQLGQVAVLRVENT